MKDYIWIYVEENLGSINYYSLIGILEVAKFFEVNKIVFIFMYMMWLVIKIGIKNFWYR